MLICQLVVRLVDTVVTSPCKSNAYGISNGLRQAMHISLVIPIYMMIDTMLFLQSWQCHANNVRFPVQSFPQVQPPPLAP